MPKDLTCRPPFLRGPLAIVGIVTIVAIVVLAGAFATPAGALPDRLKVVQMGGDIDYPDVPDGGTFKTMGGNIHIGKVHNDVDLTTMGGNVEIDSADASVKATTMGGNIEATLVRGPSPAEHDITLSSLGGEIILTVPKDYPMTINVELAYTKSNDKSFKITDNLGLEQSASKEWDNWHGTARKYLYAKGRIGNGQNQVTIKTINGDVTIKGERSQL
ncbi:MAG TPA: hypothetical protein VIX19_14915 [Terriglobales bacterium]